MKIDHGALEVSYRQFDHWCRMGWIKAIGDGGSGHDRHFEESEVRIFEIMAYLVEIGFRPSRAAEISRDAIDRGHNGMLRILRGELHATGFLSVRGRSNSGKKTSEPDPVQDGAEKGKDEDLIW